MKFPTYLTSLILLAFLTSAPAALAASKTDNMKVSATVAGTCNVSAGNLNFGTYDGNDLMGVHANVRATCTAGEFYDLGISLGGNPSGSDRQMANGISRLKYHLCKDSGCLFPVDGTPTGLANHATGTGILQTYPVWGKIDAGAVVNTGTYQDTVVVTVTYM